MRKLSKAGRLMCLILSLAVFISLFGTIFSGLTADAKVHVVSPDGSGPYNVGYYMVTFNVEPYGLYIAKVRYPAEYDGWRAPKLESEAPYPGVVVSDGTLGLNCMIDWIPEHLTSYGYITICFTPPDLLSMDTAQWAAGFDQAIETLKDENVRLLSPMNGILDAESFAVVGFSMGGAGCIEAAANNSQIDAVVALAPGADDGDLAPCFESTKEALSRIAVPVQLQVGSEDGNVLPQWVAEYYSLIPDATIKEYLEIEGANHIGFYDKGVAELFGFWIDLGLDNQSTISVEEQHTISRKYFTAWFEYLLKGEAGYEEYIFGKRLSIDLRSGALSIAEYSRP